jgi:hypothetical protein
MAGSTRRVEPALARPHSPDQLADRYDLGTKRDEAAEYAVPNPAPPRVPLHWHAFLTGSDAMVDLQKGRYVLQCDACDELFEGPKEYTHTAPLLSETAGGSAAFAVGRAENRSGVVSTDGRVGIMLAKHI